MPLELCLYGIRDIISGLELTTLSGIAPSVARDFSLMIQSCGMTAAAFTIFWMRIKLEKHSLVFCSTGAFAGMILGKMSG